MTLPLKLQSGRPERSGGFGDVTGSSAQLHLYLHPGCTYRLAITIAWSDLLGQVLTDHAFYFVKLVAIFEPITLHLLQKYFKAIIGNNLKQSNMSSHYILFTQKCDHFSIT